MRKIWWIEKGFTPQLRVLQNSNGRCKRKEALATSPGTLGFGMEQGVAEGCDVSTQQQEVLRKDVAPAGQNNLHICSCPVLLSAKS